MKLQVTQENLSRALNTIGRIASSRSTLPILSNILLTTVDNRLKLAATNLEVAMTEIIGAKITTEGSITIPAKLLTELVSNIPDGIVSLELSDNKLLIVTDQYESVINGTPADEYPVMPALNDGKTLSFSTSILKKSLQQVLASASSDDARPVLTGVYLHSHLGFLYLAATDSYRLAEKKMQKIDSDTSVSLLIPASSLNDLLRILQDDSSQTTVTYDDQQVRFLVGDDTELITRLIDGGYPDYRKLIPSKFTTTAVLKKADFISVTKVSSLFARESAGSVTIKIDEDSGVLSIRSVASQLGENTARAEAKIKGTGEVTLNSRYLLEGLAAFGGNTISFNINGKLDPVVLRDEENPDYTHIVMPVKS